MKKEEEDEEDLAVALFLFVRQKILLKLINDHLLFFCHPPPRLYMN